MSVSRCPTCAATVAPKAAWCSLCYTDLRPKEPAPAPPATEPAAPVAALTLEPGRQLGTAVAVLDPGPGEAGPGPTWPCRGCAASVEFAAMSCPDCGTPFLVDTAAPDPVSARLPQLSSLTAGRKALIMAGGTVVVAVVMIGLFYLLGLFL